jgi:hypothetical protein
MLKSGWDRKVLPATTVVFFVDEDGACPLLTWLDQSELPQSGWLDEWGRLNSLCENSASKCRGRLQAGTGCWSHDAGLNPPLRKTPRSGVFTQTLKGRRSCPSFTSYRTCFPTPQGCKLISRGQGHGSLCLPPTDGAHIDLPDPAGVEHFGPSRAEEFFGCVLSAGFIPGRETTRVAPLLGARNGRTCSSLTGQTNGLP